jgi:hypothetical protein
MPPATHRHALFPPAHTRQPEAHETYPRGSSETLGMAARWSALTALVTLAYLAFATAPSFELWPITVGGRIFNSMLSSLLQGRVDIDPALAGMEGYVRNGQTYTYFGVFPAVLRLPVSTHLWLEWTTLSSVAAASLATMLLLRTCQLFSVDLQAQIRMAVFPALGLSFAFSGPALELLARPTVYSEAILWSFAAACGFIRAAVPWMLNRTLTRWDCLCLALCAAIGLLTRASTGVALYCSLTLILVFESRRLTTHRTSIKRQLEHFAPALAVALFAVSVTAAINHARWGNPLKFNDFTTYTIIQKDAARLERAAAQGSFNASRIPWATAYYFSPDWFFSRPGSSEVGVAIHRLFDPPEGPSPFPLPKTWILWFTLAAIGASAALRRPTLDSAHTRRMAVLCSGLAVAPLLILSYLYLAFRYRAEFAPALVVLSLSGARFFCQSNRLASSRYLRFGLIVGICLLGLAQTVFSYRAALAHSCVRFGPYKPSLAAGSCKTLPHGEALFMH